MISDSTGSTRPCDRRLFRAAMAFDGAGKCRPLSIFDGLASCAADRKNPCREFAAICARRILLRQKSLPVRAVLVFRFVSKAKSLLATRFHQPSNCRYLGSHLAEGERL